MPEGSVDLVAHLNALPRPVCAELTPFVVTEARRDPAYVDLLFAPQPAFRNHFDNVQGGFAVAMIDVVLSLVVYAEAELFLPTISITTNFLAPLPLGEVRGEGRVLKRGSSVVFAEAGLWTADGRLAVQATGSAAVRS
ncbi:PaaI family thioesterase [Nocardioides humilatus]|uniref:PaaI family thioesterase n=1 Tax=Nocardioides humilatus TaxID=2607660 RepID=A0A5B1LPA7_9ACTN|nr:PaaI family thioesterase [Nocardioides humilatus]KAA1421479.1 PaaI family thioesterase [Nocardioides humilatus]